MRKKENIQVFDVPFPDTSEYERKIIVDVCMAPHTMGDIQPIIHPDMFSRTEYREMWDALVSDYNQGKTLDPFSMQPKLGKTFQEEILPYLGNAGTTDMAITEHAVTLRNEAAKRRAYFAAADFITKAVSPTTTEQDIISSTELLTRTVEGPAPLQGEIKLVDELKEVHANIDRTAEAMKQGKRLRTTTGFRYIDYILNGGMKGGQLIVLAARPSVGKTAVMLQFAKAAARAGDPVQIFSLEMPADELAERLLYSTGEVTPFQVANGEVSKFALERAEVQLNPLPLFINDFSRSLSDIITRMTQAVKKGRCKMACIDYLGLIDDALNFGNAKLYQVIARITGTLKAVAKRLEIPIVLLCQLNRDAAREDRSPELFDLRDSGSIEQDADVVFMLENQMATEKRLVVWLRKNRGGKTGYQFILRPNKTFSAFEEDQPIAPPGYEVPVLDEEQDDLPEGDDLPF